ncbi:MAG: type B 50S ribosomal protein L31 [Salinisphaera sp.]|jgi:large subunit ribosomal protein L31|nr:type B 50S ribosomal protein L31 [Salinisphaera sp.]
MRKDIHPNYRPVVFKDMGGDFAFLTRSTIESKETIQWEDGNEYPLIKLEVTSATHPFYTGKQNIMDTAGKVERFRQRYAMATKKK